MSKPLSILIVAIIAFCIMFGCNSPGNKTKVEEKGTLNVNVVHSAGDILNSFDEIGVPTFFNVAEIINESESKVNSIVLGKKISKGVKLSVHPVALLSFKQDTIDQKFIVAVDADNHKIDYEYNTFLLNNYNMQATIENWFRSQCMEEKCFDFKWENVFKALLEVN